MADANTDPASATGDFPVEDGLATVTVESPSTNWAALILLALGIYYVFKSAGGRGS